MKIGHAFEVIEEPNRDVPSEPLVSVRHIVTGQIRKATGADRLKWSGRHFGSQFVLRVAGEIVQRFHDEQPELAAADQAASAPKPEVAIAQPAGFEMADDTGMPAVFVTDAQWHTSEANGDLVRLTFLEQNISQGEVRRIPRAVVLIRAQHLAAVAQAIGAAFSQPGEAPKPAGEGGGRLVH